MECQLFKNRMLTLYKSLEATVMSDKTSGSEKAKCAEVAANICVDVLKLESEGIKAVQDLTSIEKKNNTIINKNSRSTHSSNNNDTEKNGYENESIQEQEYDDDNRKF